MCEKSYYLAVMEVEYLQKALGNVLAKCLSEVVMAQPDDPVDYMGQWLKHYARQLQEIQDERLKREVQAKIDQLEAE